MVAKCNPMGIIAVTFITIIRSEVRAGGYSGDLGEVYHLLRVQGDFWRCSYGIKAKA